MNLIKLWEDKPLEKGGFNESCPSLTPYLMEGVGPYPAVIVMPGGAYMARAPHEGELVAEWLNTLGISAFVLNYRVFPFQYPAQIEDARRSIRLVRNHAAEWKLDPGRVGIMGFSAGGHLASTAGTHYDTGELGATDPVERQSCRPDLMVLGYPVITLKEGLTSEGSKQALLGDRIHDHELVSLLSNETHVTANTPPTFLWHTIADEGVPVENSLLFAQALRLHKVPFALHLFQSGPHGIGLAQGYREVDKWPAICEGWFEQLQFHKKFPLFSEYSTLTELFASVQARAILDKYYPGLFNHPNIAQAMTFSLKTLASFPQSGISQENLALIAEQLAAIKPVPAQ